jgi:glucose-1-phosphate thymidylyltransferase
MLAGIREINVICSPEYSRIFKNLLGDGSDFGISLNYVSQNFPDGIAQGIQLSEEFLEGQPFALILGDNLFWGRGLGNSLESNLQRDGATIFGYEVANPSHYGVGVFSHDGKLVEIEEKPEKPQSNVAITGLYFYDSRAIDYLKSIKPSKRNELEISDLNRLYLRDNLLHLSMLPRGTAWIDTGDFESLLEAANFVRIIENRTGLRIGDPYEVARNKNWI